MQANTTVSIFWQFLLLGLTSFGGPAAHIGYFKAHFVDRLAWLTDKQYADLVALSHILPGPGSSQVGFAIGLKRGGVPGALAAFTGFTLPSFASMYALAVLLVAQPQGPYASVVAQLKLLAVVVVADAVLTMSKQFCSCRLSRTLALVTTISLLVLPGTATQLSCLALAAIIGWRQLRSANDKGPLPATTPPLPWWNKLILLLLLALMLTSTLVVFTSSALPDSVLLFSQFFQSGALVFGGGHVVLPLLQQSVSGMDTDTFLTGYASAQALPGPLFSLAAYLGAKLDSQTPLLGATLATIAIFLPGLTLMGLLQRRWQHWLNQPGLAGVSAAVNATVVGLLASALYRPVFTSAVADSADLAWILAGWLLLRVWRVPVFALVCGFCLAGVLKASF